MTKTFETVIEKTFLFFALASAGVVILIFGFMLVLGFPLIKGGLFFGLLTRDWSPYHGVFGIYPMIVGTLAIALLSVIFAFPLSLGCASFISVLAPPRFAGFLRKVVQMMTGIPTVVFGFVGIFLLIPIVREVFESGGMCILTAVIMLTLLISPTMILFFTESFEQVPKSYTDAVDALGGTRVQKLLYVILPCARKGILTGVMLALGRAFGDTLIALMLAGNAIQTPGSLLDSARTLTAHIALVIAADYESLEFKSIFACGITLYLFTTVLMLLLRASDRKEKP